MKTAIFPGSFDPFTIGHYDIVMRSLTLFDEIIIAIGINHSKQPTFPIEERLAAIENAFAQELPLNTPGSPIAAKSLKDCPIFPKLNDGFVSVVT